MSIRKLSNDVRLRPILELSPGDLGGSDDPGTGDSKSSRKEEAYWRQCLEKAGLPGVRPVVRDTWLVYTDDVIAPRAIRALLNAHVGPRSLSGQQTAPVDPSALQGGYALIDGNEVVLVPECCGDLANLREWQRIAAHKTSQPIVVRAGHPALSVWCEETQLFLHEKQDEGVPAAPRTFRVDPLALHAAVLGAKKELDAFWSRVARVVRDARNKPSRSAMSNASAGR